MSKRRWAKIETGKKIKSGRHLKEEMHLHSQGTTALSERANHWPGGSWIRRTQKWSCGRSRALPTAEGGSDEEVTMLPTNHGIQEESAQ